MTAILLLGNESSGASVWWVLFLVVAVFVIVRTFSRISEDTDDAHVATLRSADVAVGEIPFLGMHRRNASREDGPPLVQGRPERRGRTGKGL